MSSAGGLPKRLARVSLDPLLALFFLLLSFVRSGRAASPPLSQHYLCVLLTRGFVQETERLVADPGSYACVCRYPSLLVCDFLAAICSTFRLPPFLLCVCSTGLCGNPL